MTSTPLLIRYPGGEAEFYWVTDAPSVGDTIRRRNGDWIVTRVEVQKPAATLEKKTTTTTTEEVH